MSYFGLGGSLVDSPVLILTGATSFYLSRGAPAVIEPVLLLEYSCLLEPLLWLLFIFSLAKSSLKLGAFLLIYD